MSALKQNLRTISALGWILGALQRDQLKKRKFLFRNDEIGNSSAVWNFKKIQISENIRSKWKTPKTSLISGAKLKT